MTLTQLHEALGRLLADKPELADNCLHVNTGDMILGSDYDPDTGSDNRYGWTVVNGHLTIDCTGGANGPEFAEVIPVEDGDQYRVHCGIVDDDSRSYGPSGTETWALPVS